MEKGCNGVVRIIAVKVIWRALLSGAWTSLLDTMWNNNGSLSSQSSD